MKKKSFSEMGKEIDELLELLSKETNSYKSIKLSTELAAKAIFLKNRLLTSVLSKMGRVLK